MGLGAHAELIYGIPLEGYDQDGEPHRMFNEQTEDWHSLPTPLTIRAYGHYEDPDGPHAILSHKDAPVFWGDCWDPTRIPLDELRVPTEIATAIRQEYIEGPAPAWYLVAGYG